MRVWMSRHGVSLTAVLFLREPKWCENSYWCIGRWTEMAVFWHSALNRLHRALTGEPLPPWPLLSEIEIEDGKPFVQTTFAQPGESVTYSTGSPRFVLVDRTSRQVRVWCPPDHEPPKGWVWE